MAIHWIIPFRTLRSDQQLSVNVYDPDYTGTAVVLTGAAQPFETQEESSDDIFMPVRTQSGYLRIVDNGFAADGVTAFNWRDFIPTTDTDRPVTLTDANNNVLWQGFLQAQNFGAVLFGNPQEREFPVQCSLSVTQGIDIDTDQTTLRNFAYLLYRVINAIPYPCKPHTIVIQGDAPTMLTRLVDWQLFVETDDEGNTEATHKLYDVLENVCKFWGLSARTNKGTLYLLASDDTTIPQLYSIPYTDLITLAAGFAIQYTTINYTEVEINGGFASTDNKDYQLRGASDANFSPGNDAAAANVIELFDHEEEVTMDENGWDSTVHYYEDGHYLKTNDILSIERLGFTASAVSGRGSFNLVRRGRTEDEGYGYDEAFPTIMVHKSYEQGYTPITMQTAFMHSFSDGFFRILGDTYRGGDKYQHGSFYAGDYDTYMHFGVGTSRENAKWWDGEKWVNTLTQFRCTLGNTKPEMFPRFITQEEVMGSVSTSIVETSILLTGSAFYGYIFIDILGSINFPETDGQRAFNIRDFRIEFQKNNQVVKQQFPNSGWWSIRDKELKQKKYKSNNGNAIDEEYSIDSIFASENTNKPGYGIVLNPNGDYFPGLIYEQDVEHPEQHVCNRVTNYWAHSKRKIEAVLLTHDGTNETTAAGVTPAHMVEMDGTTMHPIAISHQWRDDVVSLIMMEMTSAPVVVYYSVQATLTHITANVPSSVVAGSALTIQLTAEEGYQIDASTVEVSMDGEPVVGAYSDGVITIASVTGDVSITAAAEEVLPYDAQVEYLQSDGMAHIDTGVEGTSDVTIEADIEVLSAFTGQSAAIFGSRIANNNTALTLQYYNSSSSKYWRWAFGNNAQTTNHGGASGDFHLSNVGAARTMVVTGAHSSTTTCSAATFDNDLNMFIFGMNNGGTLAGVSGIAYVRVAAFKIYSDGTLVRNYIPVRKNGIGYLYDQVSGKLFGNAAASGAFSYGNDVNT